jgi:diguanylate cyclase
MSEKQHNPIDEWKQKYAALKKQLTEQTQYDDLLKRSLSRLALAAQGLDNKLDRQLKMLRKELRSKDNALDDLAVILDKMEQAIGEMDESKKTQATSLNQKLADLVASITFEGKQKKRAKKLAKQIPSAQEGELTELMSDIITLVNEAISVKLEKVQQNKTRFGFMGLFNKNSPEVTELAEEGDAEIVDAEEYTASEKERLSNERADVFVPVHEILIDMLQHLSLPDKQCVQMLQLRQRIEEGIEPENIPTVIDEFASIVSSLSMQILNDKKEYEAYLKKVSGELSSLDEALAQSGQADVKAFESKSKISQQFEAEVADIQSHVNKANSLEQLKLSVNTRLAFINKHIEQYRQTDKNSFEASQAQIKALNNRIQAMEKESEALQEEAKKSRELALTDALTGMWNRQALNEMLDKEFARWQRYQSPFSVVIWDLDFFKKINDKHGHDAGDNVLKVFAKKFLGETRETDFIARFGGEEFVGVLPETSLDEALVLANKVREKVANTKFFYEGEPVPITASAGVATVADVETIEDLIKQADKRLYQAKAQGRNCCVAR